MKALMWCVLVLGVFLVLAVGCYPSPAPAASQAQIQSWGADWRAVARVCDDKGVCCYSYGGQTMQCVATEITFKHEDLIHNDYRINPPQVQRGTRVLGQSLLGGPWEELE